MATRPRPTNDCVDDIIIGELETALRNSYSALEALNLYVELTDEKKASLLDTLLRVNVKFKTLAHKITSGAVGRATLRACQVLIDAYV